MIRSRIIMLNFNINALSNTLSISSTNKISTNNSSKNLAVQEERGPRKHKKLRDVKLDSSIGQPSVMVPSNLCDHGQLAQPIEGLQHQILAQILITCMKQARNNEHFRHFSKCQQNVILKNVWSECFVLRASHWSIDIGNIVEK